MKLHLLGLGFFSLLLTFCAPGAQLGAFAPSTAASATASDTPTLAASETPTLVAWQATNTAFAINLQGTSAAQVATALAKPTETPLRTSTPGVGYYFQNELTAEQRQVIVSGIAIGKKYFGDVESIAIYADPNFDSLCSTLEKLVSHPACMALAEDAGLAIPGAMFLNLSYANWKNPQYAVQVVVHEYVHLAQYDRAQGRGVKSTDVSLGPAWLVEGTAEYLSFDVLAKERLLDMAATHRLKITEAQVVVNSLAQAYPAERDKMFETYRRYALGFLAAEYLLQQHGGDEQAMRYFDNLQGAKDWQTAFQTTFGISPEAFYADFEKFRQVNYPVLQQPH